MGANLNVRVCVFSRVMDPGPSGNGNTVRGMAQMEEELYNELQVGTWGLPEKLS